MSEMTNAAREPAVYRDILRRTGGELYIGVVGPVRTGKSTFIRELMEKLVLPSVPPGPRLDRMRDELPQAGSGRQVTTAQPHFFPGEGAADVMLGDGLPARVRLIDSVGYVVPGAEGTRENGKPRMVKTPWQEGELPFEEAARLGTDKVMRDHASIGVVVTTDGSVVDLPRAQYIAAEEQVIANMSAQNKPFVIVLNSALPASPETQQTRAALEKKYGRTVAAMDVAQMRGEDVGELLSSLLNEFPVAHIHIDLPRWVYALPPEHPLPQKLMAAARSAAADARVMRDRKRVVEAMSHAPDVKKAEEAQVDAGRGSLTVSLTLEDGLFNSVLSQQCGVDVTDEKQLLSLINGLAEAKARYDEIREALDMAQATGYGLVAPTMTGTRIEAPELSKQGTRYGVTLRAVSDALHIIRSPVSCEISPVLGTKEQSEEFLADLKTLYDTDREALWETHFFGRTLRSLIEEAMARKLSVLPGDVQEKVRAALTKMVNEGDGGMICILL